MTAKQSIKPYQQGDLDSLCAVYSVVNAMHYLGVVTDEEEARELFQNILGFLDVKPGLLEAIWIGTNFQQLCGIMRHVVETEYAIRRMRPFRQHQKVTLDQYWESSQTFLEQHHGIILTTLANHWTLVQSMSKQEITLLDSNHRQRLLRRDCVVLSQRALANNKPHLLDPPRTFFIWVD